MLLTRRLHCDGRTEIALTGGCWLENAFRCRSSTLRHRMEDHNAHSLYRLGAEPNVKVLTGDFDGDRLTDTALTGGGGWKSVPVAFSK